MKSGLWGQIPVPSIARVNTSDRSSDAWLVGIFFLEAHVMIMASLVSQSPLRFQVASAIGATILYSWPKIK